MQSLAVDSQSPLWCPSKNRVLFVEGVEQQKQQWWEVEPQVSRSEMRKPRIRPLVSPLTESRTTRCSSWNNTVWPRKMEMPSQSLVFFYLFRDLKWGCGASLLKKKKWRLQRKTKNIKTKNNHISRSCLQKFCTFIFKQHLARLGIGTLQRTGYSSFCYLER